jgi:hypothetical protein
MKKSGKGKKKTGRRFLWVVLIGAILLGGAFYFRKEIVSRLRPSAGPTRSAFSRTVNRAGTQAKPRSAVASPSSTPSRMETLPAKGRFTFFPDGRNQYAWSVKYPDGRVFKLGEEFSSDCAPSVGVAPAPATVRFEFNEQRSCDPTARKPVRVDAGSMKDVSGHGSPEVIAAIVTGGNVEGHASSLIALSPKGPRVIRRVE